MDRNSILGLLLMGGILVGWWLIMKPSPEEIERQRQKARVEDSIRKVQAIEESKKDTIKSASIQPGETENNITIQDSVLANLPDSTRQAMLDSVSLVNRKETLGVFAAHGTGENNEITVKTEKFIIHFSPKGGKISDVQLLGYQTYKKRFIEKQMDTLQLFIKALSGYNLTFYSDGKAISTGDLIFKTENKSQSISGENKANISYKVYANENPNTYIEFSYIISGNDYMIDFNVRFVGMDKVLEPNQNALPFAWTQVTPSQELNAEEERTRSNIYFKTNEEVDKIKSGGGAGDMKIENEIQWISFKQQFFSTALIAKDGFKDYPFPTASAEPKEEFNGKKNPFVNLKYSTELAIPFNYTSNETFAMQMYMGPNHYNTLKKYNIDLEDQIDLGVIGIFSAVNKWLIIPVFNFFDKMKLGYGLIILLLTLIIKIILSPITYKTFVSSAKMRLLKPDIDELSEKFKPEQALEKQQAIMQLYRRAGVSPLAGCIPALLQMPILLAMFSFFPAAIELRQQGFLWATDLSTYDSILDLPFNIPFYGSHVSLFTLLMTVTTMIYTWMSSAQMNTGGIQAQQMKIMMFIMPILFLGILNNYSAALSYYYFLSNVVSIIITLVIRQFFIDENKLRAVIEENKKRPIKKSKWQQRIEDMQKIREEQIRQKSGGKKKK
jgi:YidC/Oxa1 family membrane protein insertase